MRNNKLTLPSLLPPQVYHDNLDPGKAVNDKPILEIFVTPMTFWQFCWFCWFCLLLLGKTYICFIQTYICFMQRVLCFELHLLKVGGDCLCEAQAVPVNFEAGAPARKFSHVQALGRAPGFTGFWTLSFLDPSLQKQKLQQEPTVEKPADSFQHHAGPTQRYILQTIQKWPPIDR